MTSHRPPASVAASRIRVPSVAPRAAEQASTGQRIAVAFVIHSMRVGGAERSIARLINALDHTRFRPIVVCMTKTGPAAQWIQSAEVPVIEIGKQSPFDRMALNKLTSVLADYAVDIVHSHNWGTLVETAVSRRWAGVAGHVHAERGSVLGATEMRGFRMWLRGVVAGRAMRRCDAVVTNAHAVARRINQRCGYPEARVKVISNGVECSTIELTPEEIGRRRQQLGINGEATVLGSVGRLVPVKGFDLAISALQRLVASGGNFHLLLVGSGPEQESLKRLSESLGIGDRLHLVGQQEDVQGWLALMDIYLNTSHSEGMSQSLVEALAAGRPAVATDVGDAAVVLGTDGIHGRLVPIGDVSAIVSAVTAISQAHTRAEMGKRAASRHAMLFSAQAMAARYAELYESVFASGYTRSAGAQQAMG